MQPGFRRRIVIEPAPGCARAQLEDDYHRMVVELGHAGGIITDVRSEMVRSPWTTCEGAMARLAQTFTGVAIADAARRGERTTNCTHLHDLAVFAAAHAFATAPVIYDIHVTDPIDGRRWSRLARNASPMLEWVLNGNRLIAPAELAGLTLGELGNWIATRDRTGAEAARILRWATMISSGRAIDMPAGMPATAFPLGACHTFQLDIARTATRKPDADIDFSRPGMRLLDERSPSGRKTPRTAI